MKTIKFIPILVFALILTGCVSASIEKNTGVGKVLVYGRIVSGGGVRMQLLEVDLKQVEPAVPDDISYFPCIIFNGVVFCRFLSPGKYRISSITAGSSYNVMRCKTEGFEDKDGLLIVPEKGIKYLGSYSFQETVTGINSSAIIESAHMPEEVSLSMVMDNTEPGSEWALLISKRLEYLKKVGEHNSKVQGVPE